MDDDFFDSLGGGFVYQRPEVDTVSVNEIVELFINSIVPDIMKENNETPRFNIIFSDEAIAWFRELLKTPFKKKGFWVPNMTDSDISNLSRENQNDSECPMVIVKDHKLFFELLTEIVNEQVRLYYDYGKNKNARNIALYLLRYIWLRLGTDDLNDVELFLDKQLNFLKSREFDNPKIENYLKEIDGNKITYQVEMSETYCESTRRMYFKMYDGNEYHDLPKVYYDICLENGEKVCYISAVQMKENRHRIKTIERKLYKLNKNIPDSRVHPNFLMAVSLFCDFLREHGITHIKVPILQVLSYRYHEIISENKKRQFEKWNEEKLSYLNSLENSDDWFDKNEYEFLLEEYEIDKYMYDRFADKEDFISKSKTEGLINLFMHMTYLDDMVVINTEPYVDASYLDISIDGGRKFNRR